MDAFPAFIPLAGQTIVVIGVGEGADAKARLFDGSPARLVRHAAADGAHVFSGAVLAFIALEDDAEALAAARLAREAGVLVNVVDKPGMGDFTTPSIIDRGSVVGAIGTGGAAPVLAVRLRQEIEARWPQGLGRLAELLETLRSPVRARLPAMDARRRWLRALLSGEAARLALAGDMAGAKAEALRDLVASGARAGRLSVLSAPPSVDDLTLRAARRLGEADRLAVVGNVDPALLAFARRDAFRSDGIDETAIAHAVTDGDEVVAILGAGAEAGALARLSKLGGQRLR